MNKELKIVRLDIDENNPLAGVDAIALVEEPAIESNWMFFSSQSQNKRVFESYSDYPEAVSNNAARGIELNDKVDNKCATQVGKVRAQQLANKEAISVETIQRMYSYLSRAEEYYDENDTEACGTISYLLWGGLAGKRWSESKLKELGYFEGSIDVESDDKEMVDGIVDLLLKVDDIENRKKIVVDMIRDFALEGVEYDIDDFLSRVGVTMSELTFVDNAGGFSVGDYVSWTYAGRSEGDDRARGQITDLRVSGEVKVPGTDFTLTATEERPVALIQTIDGSVVGQYVDNLRQIQKPDNFVEVGPTESKDEFIGRCIAYVSKEGYDQDQAAAICYSKWEDRFYEVDAIADYMEQLFDFIGYADGLPIFSTPEEAEEIAWIAGCGGHHEHQVGDLTVYMPCTTHEEGMDALLQEAYEEWKKSKLKSWDSLSEEQQGMLLEKLDEVGEEDYIFKDEYIKKSGIKASPDMLSINDTLTTRIRYKYVGPRDSKNRDFCAYLLDKNYVYRKEDINNMSLAGVNTGFGAGPKNDYYDIFQFKGGIYCRHNWEAITQYYNVKLGKWGRFQEMTVQKIADLQQASNLSIIAGQVEAPLRETPPASLGFSKHQFADQQIIAGPLMIPDKLIYRFDDMNGEYFVYFPEDVIKKIAYKFMENKYTNSTNLEHDSNISFNDVYMVETWLISDPDRDKSFIYSNGEKYPAGTWYGMFKVKNRMVWEDYVKTGLVNGFSVEGYFADELLNKSAYGLK
jgi:hypothetical protein